MTCERMEKCANGEFCNYHVGILVSSCMNFKQKQEQTNEEWFCGLSTEEKAKFFDKICYSAWSDVNSRFRDMADYTDWEVWLKEKHNGNT